MSGVGEHVRPIDDEWSLWRLAALRSAGMPFAWLEDLVDDGADTAADGLRSVVRQRSFQEALAWHNPAVVRNWFGAYAAELAAGGTALSRRGQRELLLGHYAQRFCAKNDTIGFFGPVAWAELGVPGVVGVRPSGGRERRTVHLDVWAADAIAARWAASDAVRPYLKPSRHPAVHVDADGVLHRPRRRPISPGPLALALLGAADGHCDLAVVVDKVAAHGGWPTAAVSGELDGLVAAGLLRLAPRIPTGPYPERDLWKFLDGITDPSVREPLAEQLQRLDHARQVLLQAAADPDATTTAVDAHRRIFESVTGRADTRADGETPSARTAVYLDCRAARDVEIGTDLLERLRAPLSLLLRSAQWLCSEVGAAVADRLRTVYADRKRSGPVRVTDLLFAVSDDLAGGRGSVVHAVRADFQLRWQEVLGAHPGAAPVELRATELRRLVDTLFPLRPIRWSAARRHSPDLLLCRRPGGDWLWVLGELHLALNTIENRVFVTHSDDPAELVAATAADLPRGRVLPVFPRAWPAVTARTYPPPAVHVPHGWAYWSFDDDEGHPDAEHVLPGASLEVTDSPGGLRAGTPDGGWSAPLLEVLGEFLTILVVNQFQLRAPAPYRPRVTVDDLVVGRESWRLSAPEIAGFDGGAPASRLLELLRRRDVPGRFFLHTPEERKPFYVDVAAPHLLGNALRAVRRVVRARGADAYVDVTEFLPAAADLWLADADGRNHTCELRTVAVDARQQEEAFGSWT